jgi:hypothetical protein
MVFTQAGTNIPSFFNTEQKPDFCACHDHAASSVPGRAQLIFVLEPWFKDMAFQNCLTASPGKNFIDAETSVSTHEVAEAATDPIWDTKPRPPVRTGGKQFRAAVWSHARWRDLRD